MPIQGKVLENNARYTPVYEATHDVLTGGWKNDEVGQVAKSTGNTDRNYIVQSAINNGREVKEGSHGGLIYKPKKSGTISKWGQQYRDKKGIKNPIAESAANNGATLPTEEEKKAAFDTDTKNQNAFENYQKGVTLPGLTKEQTFEQATGITIDDYLKSIEEPEIKGPISAARSFRDEANEEYAKGLAADVAAGGTTTPEMFERFIGVPYDAYVKYGSIKDAKTASAPAPDKSANGYNPYADQAKYGYHYNANQQRQNADAARIAANGERQDLANQFFEKYGREPDLWMDTEQIANALAGSPPTGRTTPAIPDYTGDTSKMPNLVQELLAEYDKNQPLGPYTGDQPPTVNTNPLDTLKSGWNALFNYDGTPTAKEMDEAYEEYKAQTAGIDNSRGADDQEDRKYSYSPYVTYNDRSLADAVTQWQQNKGTRNALGAQTFSQEQQYEALYNSLRSHGLSRDNIMSMAEGEELPNLTPEQNMMLYYYAMNH